MNLIRSKSRRPLLGKNPIIGWTTIGLILSCSACTSIRQTVRSNPTENRPMQAIYTETTPDPTGSKTARRVRESEIQQLNFAQPPENVSGVHHDSAVQQIAFNEQPIAQFPAELVPTQPSPEIQQAQWVPHNQMCPDDVESCPPDPRWPAAGPNPMAPGMTACDACNLPSTEKYSDEFLCDGGDRDSPVYYDAYNRRGLETEDTILEFTDREGVERTKPSNRVCIYAPRFASVRTVSRPHEGSITSEVAGVGQLASTSGMHARLKASNSIKREMTGRIATRSRASGLETESIQGTVSQLRGPSVHDKVLNIYQSLSFVRFGRMDDADTARLNFGIQAASAWTREQYPVITAKTDMALEGHFEQSVAVITGIDEKEEAENLRIVKLADKKTAVPGDEIQFTIRYDNLGGREVHHIRIVDNLTPRLRYIDDSATSDREGRLVLQDNGEGSQILIWELEQPLKGKTGGTVTFKTRVR